MEEIKLNNSGRGRVRNDSRIQFLAVLIIVFILSAGSTFVHLRLDLTEDHRYTLSPQTRGILSRLKNDVYIQVYLDGEMDIAFRRLRRSVKEMLDEFHIASGRKLDYEFINPSAGKDDKERNNQYNALNKKGLVPVEIRARDKEGGISRKRIYPGMIVNYNSAEVPVNFLSNNTSLSSEQNLLHSEEGLEYQMIQTISTLCSDSIYKVAFLEGHGEFAENEVSEVTLNLANFFTIDRGAVRGRQDQLNKYSAVVIAGPEKAFDDKDKLAIDQYIMNGGKILWLLDEVMVNEDSLVSGETIALYRPLNIEDQLFKYGVRVNPAIVQDIDCIHLPVKVETGPSRQQIVPLPWIYNPLLAPSSGNAVTRNLNKVQGRFANYIDTVGENPDVRKTILLTTSKLSRVVRPPLMISLSEIDSPPEERQFNKSFLPVAVLLEGKFQSAFRNRIVKDLVDDKSFRMREESKQTKMIVIADGDIILNSVSQDKLTQATFGNRDFIVNCVNYLVNNSGLMELRSRELKLRLLDRTLIRQNRLMIQIINTGLPVVLVILSGIIYNYFRKKRYSGSTGDNKPNKYQEINE
jgi:ABC-2 type transport system permease protein